MEHEIVALLLVIGLFFGMLVLLEVGRRIGIRRLAKDPEGAEAGVGTVEGAVFALLGLLIAFTFSGAASRFDTRRQLIIEETNDIGTAYLRLDLLSAEAQPGLREKFRQYVEHGWKSIGNYRTLLRRKRSWPRPIGCRWKSGANRLPPAGSRALQPRRRCCSCPR